MISAIICTYNREKYLPGVLDSLKRQTIDVSQFEIILVNNNSTDRTEEISQQFEKDNPSIKYHYCIETNQGLSFARNRGVQESNFELVTFIDDDAFLAEDYLEKVVDYFKEHPTSIALGSKILLHYEGIIPKWENKYINSLLGFYNPGDKDFTYTPKDYPRGSNMSFRISVFDQVGNFNTNLGRVGRNLAGSEEKDMFKRIYEKQLHVGYIPSALVYHCVPEERIKIDFIRRQSIGTGVSERQRVTDEGGFSPLIRTLVELFKWAASFVLLLTYSLQGKFPKGWMILRIRGWISKGFFTKQKI